VIVEFPHAPVARVVVQPAAEQITRTEAKLHCHVDSTDEDAAFDRLIRLARQSAQDYTGRTVARCTLETARDAFPFGRVLSLPGGPVASVTSVTYLDDDEVSQTLAASEYVLDDYAMPERLVLDSSSSWPTTADVPNAVRVRYLAGYSLPADNPQTHPLPEPIRQAMLLLIGHLHENREASVERALAEIPLGYYSLLYPYRINFGV
jgi:uncharacterized phiE125 gp8 family phage protein